MTHTRVDDRVDRDPSSRLNENLSVKPSKGPELEKVVPLRRFDVSSATPKRTPRQSVIFVLADDAVVHPELLLKRLDSGEEFDLTIACAGQPGSLDALKQAARTAKFLVAPPGLSAEDLRELAMEETPGDIVTLLDAARLCPPLVGDQLVVS